MVFKIINIYTCEDAKVIHKKQWNSEKHKILIGAGATRLFTGLQRKTNIIPEGLQAYLGFMK